MELIGAGRASKIYALDGRRVLRRSASDAGGEARLMRWLLERGFAVPEVFEVSGGDLTMERLYGPTLAAELLAERIDPSKASDLLVGLHDRLHALDAPDWLEASPRGLDLGGSPARVLHLDLHPENVILTESGPVLVDWANAALGAPEVDVAVSWAILAGVDFAAFGMSPQWVEVARAAMLGPLRSTASEWSLDLALRYREADVNVDRAEIQRVRAESGRLD